MPNFELFARRRMVPPADKPYVTLQKRGNMSLNRAAHVALGEPEAVELLYDSEARIIGFRAVSAEAEHAFACRRSGRKESGACLIAGVAFAKYYGIDTTLATRFAAEMNDGVLCVDLNQSGTVVSSNHRANRRKEDLGASTSDSAPRKRRR